jgi:predicted nucleotidyltransferase
MDWLVGRQEPIKAALACWRLVPGAMVRFDLSSWWVEGSQCPLSNRLARMTGGSGSPTEARARSELWTSAGEARNPLSDVPTPVPRFPYNGPVDYSRPLEAVIPGTTGKVIGVLARTHAEVPIRRVAQLASVSRDRASIEIRRLVALGIVSRREVAGASLVKLERTNAAALALLALANARSTAIARLGELAKSIDPAPASLALFGSFARGTDDAESDLDVLAVRSDDVEPDDPAWLDSFGNWQDLARVVVGNPVNVIETSRHELHALARTRSLCRTIVDDAITLAGEEPSHLVAPVGDRATIVSQAVESPSPRRLSGRKPSVHTAEQITQPATAHVVRAKVSQRVAAVPKARTVGVAVVGKATASTSKRTRRAR